MADFMRTSKSGSLWLHSDLEAFNIKIVEQDIQTFFGIANLPTPNVSPIIWNNVSEPLGVPISKEDKNFFAYLNDAMRSGPPNEKTMTIDFAVHLLKMLEYDVGIQTGRRVIHTRNNVKFRMCDIDVDAIADVLVIKKSSDRSLDSSRLILVQGDKSYGPADPAPQLIAAAIAVFQAEGARDYDTFQREWRNIAGITMVGTAPQLYKIKFSKNVLNCVNYGQYPEETTIVEKLLLPSELTNYPSDGMIPLENRRFIMKCLNALKGYLDTEI